MYNYDKNQKMERYAMTTYRAGIDIGSTTVKLVLLDENGEILFGQYRRH